MSQEKTSLEIYFIDGSTLTCDKVYTFFNENGINFEGETICVFIPYSVIKYIAAKKNKEHQK